MGGKLSTRLQDVPIGPLSKACASTTAEDKLDYANQALFTTKDTFRGLTSADVSATAQYMELKEKHQDADVNAGADVNVDVDMDMRLVQKELTAAVMWAAANRGHIRAIRKMLAAGATLKESDSKGISPFEGAVTSKFLRQFPVMRQKLIVYILLNGGDPHPVLPHLAQSDDDLPSVKLVCQRFSPPQVQLEAALNSALTSFAPGVIEYLLSEGIETPRLEIHISDACSTPERAKEMEEVIKARRSDLFKAMDSMQIMPAVLTKIVIGYILIDSIPPPLKGRDIGILRRK